MEHIAEVEVSSKMERSVEDQRDKLNDFASDESDEYHEDDLPDLVMDAHQQHNSR